MGHRRLVSALGALVVLTTRASSGAADDIAVFPIEVSVATEGGATVRDVAWVDAEIARAEELFGPYGVHFKRVGLRPLDDAAAHVETRADRDRLAAACAPGVINVLVVGSLRDVDEEGRVRFGVHWRYLGDTRRHYVILSAAAPPTVLAHELGHYFGNPHSTVPDNLMSYTRTPGGRVFLDAAQQRTIRAKAREVLATGEVVAVPAGSAAAAP